MKTILVNAIPEETRIAVLCDGELQSMEIERGTHSHLVGNLYKGHVQNVLPGMQAAFVDIGGEKNAFLYLGDGLPRDAVNSMTAREGIYVGQQLPVQIVKDAIGTKGPRATMHLSLPGRNIVLMPTSAYIGISRRIESEEERLRLRAIAERLCPEGMGLIIRTVAEGQGEESLRLELEYLLRLWGSIQARAGSAHAPALLYRDADLVIRMVRDLFSSDVECMLIDDLEVYQRVVELVRCISPELVDRVRRYKERKPIFRKYRLEEEISKMGAREIQLASGGSIVIDKTEALTVIDVNTGRYVGKSNLAETVYRMNMEAAAEIIRQMRLRDLGGIIIIDFIDMESSQQKEELLNYMREQTKQDRTKTNIVDITSLGLVEVTRRKSRQNYESILYSECPCCHGRGRVESPETVSINISRDIRAMEQIAHAEGGYEVEVHPRVFDELRKNRLTQQMEKKYGTVIRIVPKKELHPESYSILLGS